MAEPNSPHTQTPSALPLGTRLGEFELREVLGIGGFGIVYLAFDHALEREVAVKEYMPESMAGRTATMHVSLRSQSDAETFALGLRSFVNEARLLARFDHPSLVKVYRFWEANGTAYMAMPVYRGSHLKKIHAAMAAPPDETWLRALLMPLLGAIEKLHDEGVFHRDIAPDNIQIEPDGRPVLLDFGAARRIISDRSQNLTAILKPAYAPIEQYAEGPTVKQGPWTDLYALGATLHYMLLGRPPAPATARAVYDDMVPLATQGLPGCTKEFLAAIDWMLATRPADRPQSVAKLRDVLEGRAAVPTHAHAHAHAAAPTRAFERTQRLETDPDETLVMAMAPPTARRPFAAIALPPQAESKSNKALIGGVVALLLVAGVAGAWMALRPNAPTAAVVAAAPKLADPAPLPAALPASIAAPAASPEPTPAPAQAVVAPAVDPLIAASAPVAVAAVAAVAPLVVALPEPKPVRTNKAREPAEAVLRPASPVVEAPVVVTPTEPAPRPRPQPLPAPKPQPPAPVVVVAPPAPAPIALASPTERCGKRVLLALWSCIERECQNPELRGQAECVKLRADQAKRSSGGTQ